MTYYAQMSSGLGNMLLSSNGSHLSGVYFVDQSDCPLPNGSALSLLRKNGPSVGMLSGLPIKSFKASKGSSGDLFADADLPAEKLNIATLTPESSAGEPQSKDNQNFTLTLQANTPNGARSVFEQAQHELNAYFLGERKLFTVPLHVDGTEFQKKVWQALLEIPYGESATYGDVARAAGLSAQHGRPVGTAVGRNPISIIIPCHRVLGGDGTLTGYTGGLARKVALLQLEGFSLS